MRSDDIPILSLLQQTMRFQSQRQNVVAENVANANTPGFTPQDVDEADFHRALRADLQARQASRRAQAGGGASEVSSTPFVSQLQGRVWDTQDAPNSETTVNGNSVVVEEQMIEAQEARMRYETSLSLYQKNLGLLRMAIRSPGR